MLLNGTGLYQRQDIRPDAPQSINPEYIRMQAAYAAQETERERLDGITEADYFPSDFDHEEYGRYLDELRATDPEPQPEDYGYRVEAEPEPER